MAITAAYKYEILTTDYSGNSRTLTNNNTVTQAPWKSNMWAEFVWASKESFTATNWIWAGTTGVTLRTLAFFWSLPATNYWVWLVHWGWWSSPFVTHTLAYENFPSGTYFFYWRRIRNWIGNSHDISKIVTVTLSKWYHVCWTTNWTTANLYVNWDLVWTAWTNILNGSDWSNTDANFRIWRAYYTGDDDVRRYLTGKQDETIVDDVWRTAGQVKTDYAYLFWFM